MTTIDINLLVKLREQTGAGVMECRKALIETEGVLEKAEKLLKDSGAAKVAKRAERETPQGLIKAYIHTSGRVGSMIEVNCETDFVARTEEFKTLTHELAMQVAAMAPQSVEDFLEQDYIRDPSKKVKDLVTELAAKLGENVRVRRFQRFALGE